MAKITKQSSVFHFEEEYKHDLEDDGPADDQIQDAEIVGENGNGKEVKEEAGEQEKPGESPVAESKTDGPPPPSPDDAPPQKGPKQTRMHV